MVSTPLYLSRRFVRQSLLVFSLVDASRDKEWS